MATVNNNWGFMDTLDQVPAPMAEVLTAYSSIPPAEQAQHITTVRNVAWKTFPYPCLARFRFVELDLARHPLYQEHVLSPLRTPSQDTLFLDLGTCLGQDVRKLIHDGADPKRVYGSDIHQAFVDAGYELFRDEAKLPRDHFLCPADVLSSSDALAELDGKVTILQVGAVFHGFELEQQEVVAERCLKLLRPGGRVLILGNQIGNTQAARSLYKDKKGFLHSNQTWKEMWEGLVKKEPWKDAVTGVEVWSRILPMGAEGGLGKVTGEQVDIGVGFMMWSVWVDFAKS